MFTGPYSFFKALWARGWEALVCSGIAKNAKNACAKSLGMVHGVYNEGEPSVGLFV